MLSASVSTPVMVGHTTQTLDEPIIDTLKRDLRAIWVKVSEIITLLRTTATNIYMFDKKQYSLDMYSCHVCLKKILLKN
jgi:hypothetical protein